MRALRDHYSALVGYVEDEGRPEEPLIQKHEVLIGLVQVERDLPSFFSVRYSRQFFQRRLGEH